MYVDDVLDSCETVSEACFLRRDLSDVLSDAGFKSRKWLSNEPSVLAEVSVEDRAQSVEIRDGENLPTQKTLGVSWNAETDTFIFQVNLPTNSSPTKRNVLSCIASLFDPLQFLSPFTVRARLLMQEIWAAGVDWDDVLPAKLLVKWNLWISELQEIPKISFPRCLRLERPTDIQLHVFSDASKVAYAAAAYLVCKYLDRLPTSCLISSKCRVSPVKAMTIPRLELMGAIIATRLAKKLKRTLKVESVTFRVDSTNMWMEGPNILKEEELTWPKKLPEDHIREDTECEQKTNISSFATDSANLENVQDRLVPEKFSSLSRLLRVTAWVKRFLTNCKLPKERRMKNGVITRNEVSEAETYWIRRAQTEAFPNGEKEKRLIKLCPHTDEAGLL
ncbi:uncharacterized protein LOC114522358 [Dendronephthya gigantea]|uniref:uncharacterized protein LOC114522358 n=1 Tax=Dendronephthya gigantea TaxID=151771 RepID=UPI00106C8E0D|nr:uncharacterized protein LOC114522358 [Dendronephthya gigantea]